ncbi:hypothetical protein [Herbiconiux sp.]|uniref:hypothetical protein n=1 Tax=Herbiconiux sp. TaxID=1871186 RepID=UPI0025BEF80D|nr:hypothetical protein [Herbiconiux sp.]
MSVTAGTAAPAAIRLPLPVGGDLVARPGAVLAVCGENGSGLDTVRREIAERILRGDRRAAPLALIGRRRALAARLDVAENIFLGHELTRRKGFFGGGIDRRRTRESAAALLTSLGCAVPLHAPAGSLDEDDRLLVEIARAIARGAELIAFEEPTARLDAGQASGILRQLRALASRGCAVVIFTQKPALAIGCADEIAVLRDGALAGRYTVATEAAGDDGTEVLRQTVLRQMAGPGERIGRAGDGAVSGHPAVSSDPHDGRPELLRVSDWSAADPLEPERHLVENAGFVLREGEVLGLAGLDDSGADALLLSVYGRSEGVAATGSVAVRGVEVDTSTVEKAIAAGLFLATSGSSRYRVRFVGGIAVPVTASTLPSLVSLGLIDRDSDTAAGDGVADRMLGAVRGLSRGGAAHEQMRGYVAAFTESERQVLLLGDPGRGLDAARRAEIHAGIRAIAAAGKGVVIASSDLGELLDVCDRIVTMVDGRVTGEVRDGDPADVMRLIAPG